MLVENVLSEEASFPIAGRWVCCLLFSSFNLSMPSPPFPMTLHSVKRSSENVSLYATGYFLKGN